MPSTVSPRAKTTVAVAASLVMAGVTSWQIVTQDGFTWWDILPVSAAVLGVAVTDGVDNTITSPAAKAKVHGALSLLAALTAALAAVVGSEPTGVSLAKLATAGLGTLAVWAYPELGPQVKVLEAQVAAGAPVATVLATAAADVSALMGPDLPAAPDPSAAPPVPAPAPVGPLPIEAQALAAAQAVTQPIPAVAAQPAA